MEEHIHTHSARVRSKAGTVYEAHVQGKERPDGTWSGWIEFHPVNAPGAIVRTEQETSQPDRKAIEYWAGGLEPLYLEGALERALRETLGEP